MIAKHGNASRPELGRPNYLVFTNRHEAAFFVAGPPGTHILGAQLIRTSLQP